MNGAKTLFILNGLPGTGKSHLAKYLVDTHGIIHLSSDKLRSYYLKEEQNEEIKYHPSLTVILFDLLNLKAEVHLLKGKSVVIDALNNYPPAWESFISLAEDTGADCVFIDNFEDETLVLNRLEQNDDRYFSEAQVATYRKMKTGDFQYASQSSSINKSATTVILDRGRKEILFYGKNCKIGDRLKATLLEYLG